LKTTLLFFVFALIAPEIFAQVPPPDSSEFCTELHDLVKAAKSGFSTYKDAPIDSVRFQSKKLFPGSRRCFIKIEEDGKQVFKANIDKSSDKEELLKEYDEYLTLLQSCLDKGFKTEERLKEDGIGKMFSARKAKGRKGSIQIFLEFTKAEMATVTYYLRLTVHYEKND